jgi:hypothetical protein
MPPRFPKPPEISAALAALGAYAEVPSERELAEQAIAAGGESVLAAMLANALYGAAIGCGMLTEGHMLEHATNPAERLSLARAQALKASGAEGAGFAGAMHWQRRTSPGRCARSGTASRRRSGKRSPPSPGRSC